MEGRLHDKCKHVLVVVENRSKVLLTQLGIGMVPVMVFIRGIESRKCEHCLHFFFRIKKVV